MQKRICGYCELPWLLPLLSLDMFPWRMELECNLFILFYHHTIARLHQSMPADDHVVFELDVELRARRQHM